jgi:hypothetical protein
MQQGFSFAEKTRRQTEKSAASPALAGNAPLRLNQSAMLDKGPYKVKIFRFLSLCAENKNC